MGWEVIALGSIDLVVPKKLEDRSENAKKKKAFIKELELIDQVISVRPQETGLNKAKIGFINIEMSGNKGIDYEGLTVLCNKYADIIDGETISFGEYCETGDGFYWERADEL